MKAARLEAIMVRHAGWEVRTLADLRSAGFRFRTIGAAWQRLRVQRSLRGFSQEQLDLAVAVLGRQSGKRDRS